MVFLVVMYGCESLTIKKVECWRIDAFVLLCWKRLLRVPWTARRSIQSILKEISPEYSLEGLMLKLTLWPPDVKNWHIWKDPDAGKDWRWEEKGMAEDKMVDGITDSMDMSLSKLGVCDAQGGLACCSPQRVRHDWVTELNWTDTDPCVVIHHCSFDLCFSNNYWCSASFHVSLAISMSSLENYLDILHIFWLGFFVFLA